MEGKPESTKSRYRWAGERGEPAVFVGREAEISRLIDQATQATRAWAPGRTVVIQGPPGAGKTALLREVGKRFLAAGSQGRVVGPLLPWQANEQGAVLTELAGALFGVEPSQFRRTLETRTGGRFGVAAGLKGEVSNRRSETVAPPAVAGWQDFRVAFAPQADRSPRSCWWTRPRRPRTTAACC